MPNYDYKQAWADAERNQGPRHTGLWTVAFIVSGIFWSIVGAMCVGFLVVALLVS